MKPNPWLIKIVLFVTVVVMSGLPAMAQATAGQQPPQNTTVDPTTGPKTPPAAAPEETPENPQTTPAEPLPNAPSAESQSTPQQPQAPQNPDGTAAAERGRTVGGPASKPAGMAIAPAKQKSPRSLLIKLGAIAAAGVAVGTVYALTRATPATPPGSGK
jgi:cytoskeletal protein RodZ